MGSERIVIVGAGFAGLNVARGLRSADAEVTLVDRKNHHLFQPLLYQVATGGLSPADIAVPIRMLLRKQLNLKVVLGEAVDVDATARTLRLVDGALSYDTLVVATGASHSYFGRDEWGRHAPGIKSLEDATEIRRRILGAFENAERAASFQEREQWLTFIIVGGGPTGVELAGALAELAHHTLRGAFRNFDPRSSRIYLLEAGERLLPTYRPGVAKHAGPALERLGVTVKTGALVTDISAGGVRVRFRGEEHMIAARTVLWSAGVAASPLGKALAAATGASVIPNGKIIVEPDFSIPGHPEIFVIGDLSDYGHRGGVSMRGTADVAMAEGRYLAKALRRRLEGRTPAPFRFLDRGTLAVVGRSHAAVDIFNRIGIAGLPAWWLWLFLHLLYLVGFENRLLVLIQWGWSFITRNRSALLITDVTRGRPSAPE